MRRAAICANNRTSGRSFDGVSRQPGRTRYVPDLNLLERRDIRRIHEELVDR